MNAMRRISVHEGAPGARVRVAVRDDGLTPQERYRRYEAEVLGRVRAVESASPAANTQSAADVYVASLKQAEDERAASPPATTEVSSKPVGRHAWMLANAGRRPAADRTAQTDVPKKTGREAFVARLLGGAR